jgi:AraC family transcriptional regulator
VREAYARRFARVLAHIDAHLEDELPIEELAAVAGLSRHHFQRQFRHAFGLAVHRYVQLVRLRRASYQLAFRGHRILEIALAAGYTSHEAFTRAFHKQLGQLPSDFRARPDWPRWQQVQDPVSSVRGWPAPALGDVAVITVPRTRLLAMQHRGEPQALYATIRRFIGWRRVHRLSPATTATYNLVYDSPADVRPADFRFDLCVASETHPAGDGVVERVLPAGRRAHVRHVGSDDVLWSRVSALYEDWLPDSGEAPDDVPLYLCRRVFFPDVREHEAVTDVYLPLADVTSAQKP